MLAAHPTRTGAPGLARLVARLEGVGPADTRSPAEILLLALCEKHGLPAPRTNVLVEGMLVDCHWPGTGLVVEVDGFQFHRMPTAFDADRDRDQRLKVAGYRAVRFSYNRLTKQPGRTAARLRRLLAAASGSPQTP